MVCGKGLIFCKPESLEAPPEVWTADSMCWVVVQVCPKGVPADLMAEEYSQMAKALIVTATTATPQLPLTALLVQVSRH